MTLRAHRLSVLGRPDFRRFFTGYATSLLGSAMSGVALAFAVLATGGGGTALGAVMAARILPLVLLLLLGGVATDRLGSRAVMLVADVLRCSAQAAFAVVLLTGRPGLAVMLLLAALGGIGEGLFTPALSALIPTLSPPEDLAQANSLLQIARSGATVAGPALAGLLAGLVGPAPVLAVDAASYAVSVLALSGLPTVRQHSGEAAGPSLAGELRAGWSLFRGQTWLWVTTLHVGLFNLLVWAPFLVLGPVLARDRLGGAGAWGAVMACYGTGAVAGGLLLLRRRPGRPLLVAAVASLCWALPSAALALGLPAAAVCVGAAVAGVGSSVNGVLGGTVIQQRVPAEYRGRIGAYTTLGAFVLGPLGLAAAGPLASAVGATVVLGCGALWLPVAVAAVVAVPEVRAPDRGTVPGARSPRRDRSRRIG
ncbi:MFS transporter [Streptacidiphilus cavernicola]|uniref:MFS transporter n=1 Tax=Streptacidiphilus cavernicola TaxID=3342716 RepID=A0ABV6W0A1_9ACTN